jgi:hypothetical protein
MSFSYNNVWADLVGLARAHGRLLAPVAGVFFFLPALLIGHFLPVPDIVPANSDAVLRQIMDYYAANALWLVLQGLAAMIGSATILRLVLTRGVSVGAALVFALTLLPFFFLLSLLESMVIGAGLLLFLVPGCYLFGRLAPATAVMVAEERRNPIAVLERSFALTQGNGWAVFGFVLVIGIVSAVVAFVIGLLCGIAFQLVAAPDIAMLLTLIVDALVNAASVVLLTLLYAALYRALSGSAAPDIAATFH